MITIIELSSCNRIGTPENQELVLRIEVLARLIIGDILWSYKNFTIEIGEEVEKKIPALTLVSI